MTELDKVAGRRCLFRTCVDELYTSLIIPGSIDDPATDWVCLVGFDENDTHVGWRPWSSIKVLCILPEDGAN